MAADDDRSRCAGWLDLLVQAPVSLAVLDTELRYLAATARWKAAHGLDGQDLTGRNPYEVFPSLPDDWRKANERALAGSASLRQQSSIVDGEGRVRWVSWEVRPWYDHEGAIGGIIVVTEDITASKLAEKSSAQIEGLFNEIFQRSAFGIVATDLEGRIELCNAAFIDLAGGLITDLQGVALADLVPKGARNDLRRNIDLLRRGELPNFDFEGEIVAGNGRAIPVRAHILLLTDGDGRPSGLVMTVRDTTERQRAEEQLSRARRMEAIGGLASGIAHDFDNVLAVISGNLQLAQPRMRSRDGRKLIRNALNATRIGAAFNKRLLSMARREEVRPQTVDVNRRVRDTADLLDHILGETIELQLDLTPELRAACADPDEIDAALLNLVINARDAMPEGGVVVLRTRNADPSELDGKTAGGAAGFVGLSVTDTGTGMPPAVLARASEPFFTTKRRGKGTGLGLSSVCAFTEQSGGCTVIESRPEQGTTVTLFLPCAEVHP